MLFKEFIITLYKEFCIQKEDHLHYVNVRNIEEYNKKYICLYTAYFYLTHNYQNHTKSELNNIIKEFINCHYKKHIPMYVYNYDIFYTENYFGHKSEKISSYISEYIHNAHKLNEDILYYYIVLDGDNKKKLYKLIKQIWELIINAKINYITNLDNFILIMDALEKIYILTLYFTLILYIDTFSISNFRQFTAKYRIIYYDFMNDVIRLAPKIIWTINDNHTQ